MDEKEPAIEWLVCVAVSIEGHIRPEEGNQYASQQLIYFYFSFGSLSASNASLSGLHCCVLFQIIWCPTDNMYIYVEINKKRRNRETNEDHAKKSLFSLPLHLLV